MGFQIKCRFHPASKAQPKSKDPLDGKAEPCLTSGGEAVSHATQFMNVGVYSILSAYAASFEFSPAFERELVNVKKLVALATIETSAISNVTSATRIRYHWLPL